MEQQVDHLDDRGRCVVKAQFRERLKRGYVQILTPDGVLFKAVPRGLDSNAPSLSNVEDELLQEVP